MKKLIVVVMIFIFAIAGCSLNKPQDNQNSIGTQESQAPQAFEGAQAQDGKEGAQAPEGQAPGDAASEVESTENILTIDDAARGNHIGNINNFAIAATSSDKIYFRHISLDNGLYSMDMNGSNIKRLSAGGSPNYINATDGYLFYMRGGHYDLVRYDLSTDKETILAADHGWNVTLAGPWVYYINSKDNNTVYRVDINGKNRQQLNNVYSYYINIYNDKIYYVNKDDSYSVYVMDMDGKNQTKVINESAYFLNIVDDWMYYSDRSSDYNIYKIKMDGTQKTLLSSDKAYSVNIYKDKLYYQNQSDGNKLYVMNLDGSEKKKIIDQEVWYYSLAGDNILYQNIINTTERPASDRKLYRARLDGSENQLME